MAYVLEAVIATAALLRGLPGDPVIVSLGQGLSLVPVTPDYAASVADPEAPELAPFLEFPRGFEVALARCSLAGPIAYVEVELFGGDGPSTAQVWEAGAVVFGPIHVSEDELVNPPEGSPASQALRRLGVDAGSHHDEFDAVGLGRHRFTEQWLPRGLLP
jgi:hypothetical protein